jgi:hypothetical protein
MDFARRYLPEKKKKMVLCPDEVDRMSAQMFVIASG